MPTISPSLTSLRLRGRSAVIAGGLAVCAIGAYLRLSQLGEGGLGNPFYAAAVRSMTKSLHNFFFVSFDPLGTFMVDKPPLALWLQTFSSLVFGYSGFALVLPQALAGIVAVILVLAVVRSLHDDFTALAAGLALAVLPASVLVSRNNTMDTLVMALSLGSLALAIQAARGTSLRPLVLAGVLMGLAFNTKGFEAFVALPGIAAYFWLASDLPRRRRLTHLTLSGVAAAVIGLSWLGAVSLFPPSERPLVLNSDGNSIWDLTFGYNGIDRLFGGDGFNPANALTSSSPAAIPIGVLYGGERGPFRVFGEFPGPLIAVLVPAALAGAALFALDLKDGVRRPAAALWLLWLAAGLTVFSASRLGSPHYFEAFTPALAACFAYASWTAVFGGAARRLVALAGAGASAFYALDRLTELGDAGSLIGALAVLSLASSALAAALIVVRRRFPLTASAAFLPFASVLAIMFAMSFQAVRDAPIEGVQPGLVLLTEDRGRDRRFDPAMPAYSFLTGRYDYLSRPLAYLQARSRPGEYLLGVRSFYLAAALISQRDMAVLPLYSEFRNRPELPIEKLRGLLERGDLGYVLVSPQALDAAYPQASALILAACADNVSRPAGVAPQTGLQLLRCR